MKNFIELLVFVVGIMLVGSCDTFSCKKEESDEEKADKEIKRFTEGENQKAALTEAQERVARLWKERRDHKESVYFTFKGMDPDSKIKPDELVDKPGRLEFLRAVRLAGFIDKRQVRPFDPRIVHEGYLLVEFPPPTNIPPPPPPKPSKLDAGVKPNDSGVTPEKPASRIKTAKAKIRRYFTFTFELKAGKSIYFHATKGSTTSLPDFYFQNLRMLIRQLNSKALRKYLPK